MSIRGIDAQLMVTRAAELAKDASAQLKKNELMHDYLAAQTRALEQQEKKTVSKTAEVEQAGLQRELGEGGGQGHEPPPGGRHKQKKKQGGKAPGAPPDGEKRQIDIRI